MNLLDRQNSKFVIDKISHPLVGILGAIVEPFMGTMLCAFAHLLNRFPVASQFVCHNNRGLG